MLLYTPFSMMSGDHKPQVLEEGLCNATGRQILGGMDMRQSGGNSGQTLLRYALQYGFEGIVVLLLVILQVTLGMLLARQLGQLVDGGLLANREFFRQVFYFLVVIWLSSDLALFGRQLMAGRLAEKVVHGLREKIALHISRISIPSLEAMHSGDYVSRVSNDMHIIKTMLSREIPGLIQGVLGFAVALVVMMMVSFKVTVLTVAVAPVMMLIASIFGGRMGASLTAWQSDIARVNVLAQDAVSGIVTVKAYNLSGYLVKRLHFLGQRVVESSVKLAFTRGQLNSAMMVLSVMPFLILFGVGGFDVIKGRLSLGQLLMMLNLLNNLTWPLQGMAQNVASVKAALQSADRLFEILRLPTEPLQGEELVPIDLDTEYAVEFDRVSFAYEGKEAVLSELDLKIRTGEALAIVGASGSGKSTLLSILFGFRTPCSGSLRFFGRPYHALGLSYIRSHIAYVPQDDFFMPTTIAENIGYGRVGASLQEVRDAAKRSGADQFISELPGGYRTLLSERGGNLSGGQRQRISLARAILRNAPLLVLDEATAAIDTESERAIYESVSQMKCTRVIVTHRLHLLEQVDRIVVLDQGRIVEEGTHVALLGLQGYYANLFRHGQSENTGTVEVKR